MLRPATLRSPVLVLVFVLGIVFAPLLNAAPARPQPLPIHTFSVRNESSSTRLWLTVFPSRDFTLRVVDNADASGTPRYKTMDTALHGLGALAGCNGGFFKHTPFVPVGGMIASGITIAPVEPQSWMKGLLVVRGELLSLEPADRPLLDASAITELLQSGPWLVRDGVAEKDNSRSPSAPRAFIGHDGRGLWFVGVSTDCTLHALGHFLREAPVRAVIDVQQAFNLDGGPSAALWVRGSVRDFYRQEKWPVRNYLGVFPKTPPAPVE